MNPLPILRALAHAGFDWLRLAPKLIWSGWVAMAGLLLIAELGKHGLEQLRLSLAIPELAATLVQFLFVCAIVAAAIVTLSFPLRRADHFFFVSGKQRGKIMGLTQALSCAAALVAYLGGAAVLIWIGIVGGAHRLGNLLGMHSPNPADPSLILNPATAPKSYLLVVGLLALLLVPMLIRLQLLPAVAAIEEGRARGGWALLSSTTKGRGPAMLAVAAVQLLIVILAIFTTKVAVAVAPETALYFGSLPISSALAIVLVGGSWLSLLAALEVAAVRHFVGLPITGEDISDQHFEVADENEARFVPPAQATDNIGEFEARPADDPASAGGLQQIPESAIGAERAASAAPYPVSEGEAPVTDPGPVPPPPAGLPLDDGTLASEASVVASTAAFAATAAADSAAEQAVPVSDPAMPLVPAAQPDPQIEPAATAAAAPGPVLAPVSPAPAAPAAQPDPQIEPAATAAVAPPTLAPDSPAPAPAAPAARSDAPDDERTLPAPVGPARPLDPPERSTDQITPEVPAGPDPAGAVARSGASAGEPDGGIDPLTALKQLRERQQNDQ